MQVVLGVLGILSNATVIVVFASHKKYRKKIPNIFIINQVSVSFSCEHAVSQEISLKMYGNILPKNAWGNDQSIL